MTVPSSARPGRLLESSAPAGASIEGVGGGDGRLELDAYGRQKRRCIGCDIGTIYGDGVAWCLGCRYRVGAVPEAGAGRLGRMQANA